MATAAAAQHFGDSILYISALIGLRPRPVDRYIDYFGDSVAVRRTSAPGEAEAGAKSRGFIRRRLARAQLAATVARCRRRAR